MTGIKQETLRKRGWLSLPPAAAVGIAIAVAMSLLSWFIPPPPLSLFDGARFLELFILAWVALLFLAVTELRQALLDLVATLPGDIRLALAALAVLAGASTLFCRFPSIALQEIALLFLLLIFACGCAVIAEKRPGFVDRIFTWSLISGALFFLLFFFLAFRGAIVGGRSFSWVTPFVTFSNIRFFTQFQAYTLPLLVLPLLAFEIPGWLRLTVWLTVGCWWALQFASGSRSLWVAFPAAALVLAFSLRRSALPWLRAQGWSFVLGDLIYFIFAWQTRNFGLKKFYGVVGVMDRGFNDSGRFDLWRSAGEMIRSSPWLGIGPGHFGFYNFAVAAHPHNTFLQIAAEYGLPAAILAAFLAVRLLFHSLRVCRTAVSEKDRNVNIALTAALLTGLAEAMVSGNTVMPQSQLLLCFIAGWLIGRNTLDSSPPTRGNAGKPKGAGNPGRHAVSTGPWAHTALIILVLAAIGLQYRGASEYYRFRTKQGYGENKKYQPRFWQDGHWPLSGSESPPAKKAALPASTASPKRPPFRSAPGIPS